MFRQPLPWLRTILLLAAFLPGLFAGPSNTIPIDLIPPKLAREFRGAWVASVGNLDWPSKPGLSTSDQKKEMIAILDRAVELGLNVVVLQVRSVCDALYSSPYEPWSEYLTGKMGQPPNPYYDPLEFAITEAHARGLELHAWFNPFRAGHPSHKSPASPRHITQMHPKMVHQYGEQLWLDPGDVALQAYTTRIVVDVVRRYDIDGVHLDDYFYPYPEKNSRGEPLGFPDDATWRAYQHSGGRLSRSDWRRENINRFVHHLNSAIKSVKWNVKFGISPFGIWQPGYPRQVRGLNSYETLYADSRLWLSNGWVDYFAPQLYWGIEPKEQSYPALLEWWKAQNKKNRLLVPGDAVANVVQPKMNRLPGPGDPAWRPGPLWRADEIANQLEISRRIGADGQIHWNMSALMHNNDGVADRLKWAYAEPAIVPAMEWMRVKPPSRPALHFGRDKAGELILAWKSPDKPAPALWALQTKRDGKWETELIPGHFSQKKYDPKMIPEAFALTAFNRYKLASPAALCVP